MGIPVWLFSTSIVLNSLDPSQVSTLCQEHQIKFGRFFPLLVNILLLLLRHLAKISILVAKPLKRRRGIIERRSQNKGA